MNISIDGDEIVADLDKAGPAHSPGVPKELPLIQGKSEV